MILLLRAVTHTGRLLLLFMYFESIAISQSNITETNLYKFYNLTLGIYSKE